MTINYIIEPRNQDGETVNTADWENWHGDTPQRAVHEWMDRQGRPLDSIELGALGDDPGWIVSESGEVVASLRLLPPDVES